MSQLKIKIKLGNCEIELDGEEEVIMDILKNKDETNLPHIIEKFEKQGQGITQQHSVQQNIQSQPLTSTTITDAVETTLGDLIVKNYPKSSTEWILCIGYFALSETKRSFKREDISRLAKEHKITLPNPTRDFNKNIRYGFVSETAVKGEFVYTTKGHERVMQIISGKTGKDK